MNGAVPPHLQNAFVGRTGAYLLSFHCDLNWPLTWHIDLGVNSLGQFLRSEGNLTSGTARWPFKIVAITAHNLMQLVLLVYHPADDDDDDGDDDSLGSKHVAVSIVKQDNSLSSPIRPCPLTFQSLPVTMRTTRITLKNSAHWLHCIYVFCVAVRRNNTFSLIHH